MKRLLIGIVFFCASLALAEPTYTYTENSANATTDLVLTKPSSVVSGSKCAMVVWYEWGGVGNDFNEPDDVDDWDEYLLQAENSDTTVLQIFTRTMDGTEGTTETLQDADGTISEKTGFYICAHGSKAAEFFNGTAGATYVPVGNSGTHVLAAGTTDTDDSLAFAFLGFDGADGSPFGDFSTGWSLVDDITPDDGNGNSVELLFATKTIASAGTTGTATITTSVSDEGVGKILMFAPEASSSIAPLAYQLREGN